MPEIVSRAEAAKRLDTPRHELINPPLKANILRAVEALFPVKSENGSIEVRATDIRIDDSKFDAYALADWQKARQEGGTVAAPIRAALELWRDGKKVQSVPSFELGKLPLMGSMGTFMAGGNDYYVPMAQPRLKPGAYTREKANGQYETFIPMRGAQMTVWMDPAKGLLKIGIFSSNVSWYALVKALGATDDQIVTALGGDKRARELLDVNRVSDTKDVTKFFMTVFEHKLNRDLLRAGILKHDENLTNTDYAAQVTALKQWFEGKQLDPFVTKQTLGVAIEHAGVDLLLRSAKRILDVQRGDSEPDDRDAPEYKAMHGVEDLIPERVTKMGRFLQRKLLQRLGKPDSTIAPSFGSNWLGPAITGNFTGNDPGLTNTAEAANPLAILGEQSKLVLTGAGGIEGAHAITMGARLFRPTSVGFIDPTHTPEGPNIGIVTHAASNVRKVGQTLTAPFAVVTGGKIDRDKFAFLTIEEAAKAVIGYPEGWEDDGTPKAGKVRANKDGEIATVDPKTVQYVLPSGAAMFDQTSNSASFLAHTHSNRAQMAGKHLTQALPLAQRELPLASMVGTDGTDIGEKIARSFVIRARVGGKVTEVAKDHITVGSTKHEIFDQYPMQAKVALHHTPVVKVGDMVKEGDLLADSNYSKDGKLALGLNLFSAYMPWKNASNFEDAIVISDSAAHRLASEHMHRLDLDLEPGISVDKKLYLAQFPTKMTGDNFAKLDDSGVIKEGVEIKMGEVVIAACQKQTFDPTEHSAASIGMIHKKLSKPYRDCGVIWNELPPGKVYRVVKTAKVIEVHVQTLEPMHIGDKLSMGSAAKGTVSQIVPDDKMPRTKAGKVVEVILNPHGVAGRINPSQTIEQAAGKLVKDGGVPYQYSNFDNRDHAAEIAAGLKKAGLSHTEALFDPETGKDLEAPVATGYNYMVKLDHSVRKKFSARARDGYTLDETPIAGRGRGGQSYDQLTTYALLGHNAHALIAESAGIRGTKNDEYWRAYQAGETPPPPKVPFVYHKLQAYLNAAGVDTKQHGNILHFMPMTDARTLERSNGQVTRATMIKAKNLAEEKGGLFDPEVTGGLKGEHWSHITLHESIPHPLYEKVIRDVCGLKSAEFYGLLGHTRWLDPKTGKISETPGGITGEEAFRHLLSFNLDERTAEFKAKLKTAVGSDRNKYNRAVHYLDGLRETKLKAADAYMVKHVPVLPPKYRGIDELSGGALRVAPSNILYRDVMLTNEALAASKTDGMPTEHLANARTTLYQGVGALVGVNNALTHRDDREDAKGFVDIIKGTENKNGLFQRMVARRRNDFTGRSTIEPDANLGADEIGIPEDMAWKIYQPVIVRRLALAGWKPADAMLEVEKRGPAARSALDAELETRLVIINRAPSLHRGSVSAHRATMVSGKEIKISPAIIGPLNADFDGDTASITVPITEAARREAYNLMPSNNLFYDKNRSLAYGVDKDVVTGLFMLTSPGTSSGKSYESADAAIAAFEANKDGLRMGSLVKVEGQPTQVAIGWLIFLKLLPARYTATVTAPITGPKLKALLENIAKNSPGDYTSITRRITQAGFTAAAMAGGGVSSSVNELAIDRTKIKRMLDQMEREINAGKTMGEKRELALKAFKTYAPQLDQMAVEHLDSVGGAYSTFLKAKPSGKITPDQFRQMLVSPMLVSDVQDRVVPAVIKTGYGGGMTTSDYILTTPGARKGLVAKALSTALPGFLAKEIAGNMGPVRIGEKDCGTQNGIELALHGDLKDHDADLLDRHLLHNIPGTSFKRNDVVTPRMIAELKDRKTQMIWVRSPMTCEAASAPCQMCAGRSPNGELHPVGANIGLNYGQAVSEPSTQLTLKIFHSGGTVGAGEALSDGFARMRELLSAPTTVRDQGVLADVGGTVTGIRPAPQGGQYVTIRATDGHEVEQHVLTGRALKVKRGETVTAGQPLSDGNYPPQEIAAKRGLLAAQQYVVDEARKAYASAGVTVRKPVLEVVAAGMMRFMEVTDDGGEKDLTVGDVLPENEFRKRQRENPRIMGMPSIPGVSFKPLMSKDLLERLNFQRLEGSIAEIPAIGGKSDLTGAHSPISGIAYGANFRPGQAAYEMDSAFVKHQH